MDEEIGTKADPFLAQEIAGEISSTWKFKQKSPAKPIVLLVGGFQGAGKTTSLEILKKGLDLIVISPDEIRHKLFEKGWTVSEEFVHTVNAVRNNLLKIALSSGYHVVIDQLITPARIDLAKKIISENGNKYRCLSVYLQASEKTLTRRVKSRRQFGGIYKGTINELKDSISKHGQPDLSTYDLVLDTEKLNPSEISDKLAALVVLIH